MSFNKNKKVKKIIVTVPATSANFGSGFDVFGAALELRNTIVAEVDSSILRPLNETPHITVEGEGKKELPQDKSNLVWKAMCVVFNKLKQTHHSICGLKLINKIPLSSGLGSSAAAIVGGLLIANEVAGGKVSLDEIINIAARMEGHPDNIVPAVVGGFCICCNKNNSGEVFYIRISLPSSFKAVIVVPYGIHYSTAFARKILPKKISLKDAVYNLSRSALLAASFALKDSDFYKFIKEGMSDRLHQSQRLSHIPGAREAITLALKSGAVGVALSGSGPSLIAISDSQRKSHIIARALERGFTSKNIRSRSFILDFASSDGDGGARIKYQ